MSSAPNNTEMATDNANINCPTAVHCIAQVMVLRVSAKSLLPLKEHTARRDTGVSAVSVLMMAHRRLMEAGVAGAKNGETVHEHAAEEYNGRQEPAQIQVPKMVEKIVKEILQVFLGFAKLNLVHLTPLTTASNSVKLTIQNIHSSTTEEDQTHVICIAAKEWFMPPKDE